jgi:predicted membrane protein
MSSRGAETESVRISGWMRSAALVGAGVVSLVLMLDPYVLHGVSSTRLHVGVPLLLLSVSGAFVYGFGFRPANGLARATIHPLILLALFAVGVVALVTR